MRFSPAVISYLTSASVLADASEGRCKCVSQCYSFQDDNLTGSRLLIASAGRLQQNGPPLIARLAGISFAAYRQAQYAILTSSTTALKDASSLRGTGLTRPGTQQTRSVSITQSGLTTRAIQSGRMAPALQEMRVQEKEGALWAHIRSTWSMQRLLNMFV
jgi:hypothetical protein